MHYAVGNVCMLRSNPCRLTNTQFSREEMLAIVEEAAVGFGRQPLHALRMFWKGVDRTPSGCPTHHYIPASWLTYASGLQAGRCTQSLAQAALQRGCYLACERCSWDEEREEMGPTAHDLPCAAGIWDLRVRPRLHKRSHPAGGGVRRAVHRAWQLAG